MIFSDIELTKLDDIVKLMKSSEDRLDMLENGTKAGRETIKETAEEGLTDISQSGMKRLKYELPKDVLKRAKEKLIVLNVARTELIARLDDLLANGSLTTDTKVFLNKAKNSLLTHLTQDDLVGALRDIYNKPVRRSGDGYTYQHLKEVNQGLESLENARDALVQKLRRTPRNTDEFRELSDKADAIAEMIRKTRDFLETK